MNKYKNALFTVLGRKFAQLMIESKMTPEQRIDYYYRMNPDSAMSRYGDSGDFTAFIYSSATNTLFCQPGSEYHQSGLSGVSELKQMKNEPKNTKTFFGRYGKTFDAGGFITLWDISETDIKTNYNYDIGDINDLKKMLTSMVNRSIKIVGDSPAELPDENYVFTSYSSEYNRIFVKDIINDQDTEDKQDTENPECKKIAKVNIRGREMDLGTAFGNLHMVKGPELQFMKTSICAQHDRLQSDLEKHSCKSQLGILDDILNKLSCPSKGDHGEWNKLKSQGRTQYRQGLKRIFSNPEKIGDEFRTQKDVDDAWDELQHGKRESKLSFKRWLTLKEQGE